MLPRCRCAIFFNAIYSHQTPSNKDKRNVTLSEIKALNDRLNTARRKVFEELIDPVDFKLMKADCEQEINELERKLVATQSNNPKSIDAMLDCDYYLPNRCEFQKKTAQIGKISICAVLRTVKYKSRTFF